MRIIFPSSSSSCLVLFLVIITMMTKNATSFSAALLGGARTTSTILSPSSTAVTLSCLQQQRTQQRTKQRRLLVSIHHCRRESAMHERPPSHRSYEEALEHNKKRTDVKRFLTQRALQSFIYLLIECRDPHTVQWLESTYKFGNLEQYHGTGGLNLVDSEFFVSNNNDDWDTMLLDLLHRPNDKVIVAARRRGRGHGGWSKNNPYLQDRFIEFEINIEPASLVTRILSVRNQIAMEWANSDLDLLDSVTQMILSSYHEHQNAQRQAEQEKEHECVNLNDDNGTGGAGSEDDECFSIEGLTALYGGGGSSGGVSASGDNVALSHGGRGASSSSSSSSSNSDPLSLNSLTRDNAYDRIAMEFLNNKMLSDDDMGSSPQRKGNFDLLTLLATQESVHRVLREYQDGGRAAPNNNRQQQEQREVSWTWLRDFYIPRIATYFDGDGKYGRADDFLQELLLTPPMTKRIEDNSNGSHRMMMALIDPMRIAEDILRQRSLVAKEWKEIMQHQVPSDHINLQREILTMRMSPPPPREQNTVDSSSSSSNEEKGFE